MLYDGFFKEVFNPEATPKRLEELLSLLMQRSLKIKQVLPNDSVRLGAESSLLYTDIIVQLEDDSLANVEIQKIGYAFIKKSGCTDFNSSPIRDLYWSGCSIKIGG